MSTIKAQVLKLQEERTAKLKDLDAILQKAKSEAQEGESVRDFTPEEQAKIDKLKPEIEALNDEISKKAKALEIETQTRLINHVGGMPVEDPDKEFQKASERMSITKFIRESPNGGEKLEGIEKELHQEAVLEARELGYSIQGAGIPGKLLGFSKKFRGIEHMRSINVEQSATNGGETVVGEDRRGIIPVLTIDPLAAELGVTLFPNQKDDLYFVIGTKAATSSWLTEVETVTETDIELSESVWKPIRNSTYQLISGRTLMQDTVGVQNYVRMELGGAISRSVDEGILIGTGSGQLTGLSVQSGVNAAVGGTNGATLTRAHILELKTKLKQAFATMGNVKYLFNAATEEFLKQLAMDAGSGRFVWPDTGDVVNGIPALTSEHVPDDADKGTSTGVCSHIYLGDWSKYYLAQFGGLDVMVDGVTKWDTNQVKIGLNTYWDGKAVQPACFAVMEDALLS